ncbi:putative ABC transport system permease protein [Micromonospora phaseoli]|uniref:Putative ABC transport system permease protein n=1 Tax=Micromonospora phaseoli TaxID=1144548 RepID=A0A1H6U1M0_9ACTN|nr:FtsX-like permease family protein [Micromonospora phaseoli]PZV98835.1 putative ABC transport system permease protein [Micromonospora phaseoli]GIJ76414.1 membrane protein [Micromonospora phaseoli]SEI86219.1 putative ABC transport system permease protein [Micromonospora phaseoli]
MSARRIRAYGAHVALLAALGLVAALLVTAAPRLSNGYADRGLRADVAQLPHLVRDVSLAVERPAPAAAGQADLDRYAAELPQPLPGLVDRRWYAASLDEQRLVAIGDDPPMDGGARKEFGLRAQTGVQDAAELTAGRWPRTGADGPAEVTVSATVAETLSLRPGQSLRFIGQDGTAQALLVGVFEPRDAADPVWDDLQQALNPIFPLLDGDPYIVVGITDWAGVDAVSAASGVPAVSGWRYRLGEQRLDTGTLPAVTAAVAETRRMQWAGATVQTSLDTALARFAEQLYAVQALLAVVQAGLIASLLGLILLAARLAVLRRRDEFALLRARGASLSAIGLRTLAEAAPVQPLAVLVGWLAGTRVPGRADGVPWLVLLLAVLTTAVVPVLAMLSQRQVAMVAGRADVARQRPSVRRLTVEAGVLVLAVLGVVLLRRRGLDPAEGVDAYLSSVPVLVAVAAALVAMRLLPWPLRLAGRLAVRARGALLFLGVARAGRGAPVALGPLAVLIVAVSTGVFGGVVATTVSAARDRAATLTVPADAWLTGYTFSPDAADALTQVPGVQAVARVWVDSNRRLLPETGAPARQIGTARVLVVDAPAFAEVVARSGVEVDVPAALRAAARGDGPVPAVVSPKVATDVGDRAAVDVQGRLYEFQVAEVADAFPGVGLGTERFVVLPWQAMPEYEYTPIIPNRYLLAGEDIDEGRLLGVADETQRQRQSAVLGVAVTRTQQPAELQSRQAYREGLDRTGANDVLTLAFTAGAAGGAALAVLAVGFAVVADAAGRGRMLSRLRTLGLSAGSGRRLLVYELVPLVVVAAVTGAVVGAALPRVLGPTLGLSAFVPDVPLGYHLNPLVAGSVLGLVVLGLATGLAVENLSNRRMRLGEVLRLGEENA